MVSILIFELSCTGSLRSFSGNHQPKSALTILGSTPSNSFALNLPLFLAYKVNEFIIVA